MVGEVDAVEWGSYVPGGSEGDSQGLGGQGGSGEAEFVLGERFGGE